jgi:hypothetical protein
MALRFLGYVLLCLALAATAFDGARMLADKGELAFTSVFQHWQTLHPAGLAAAQQAVESVNPYLWSPLLMTVLVLPAWMVAGGLGIMLYMAGYRRPRPDLPDAI